MVSDDDDYQEVLLISILFVSEHRMEMKMRMLQTDRDDDCHRFVQNTDNLSLMKKATVYRRHDAKSDGLSQT